MTETDLPLKLLPMTHRISAASSSSIHSDTYFVFELALLLLEFLDESLMFVHHGLLLSQGSDFGIDGLDKPVIFTFERLAKHDEGDVVSRPQQLVEQTTRTILRRLCAENLSAAKTTAKT